MLWSERTDSDADHDKGYDFKDYTDACTYNCEYTIYGKNSLH